MPRIYLPSPLSSGSQAIIEGSAATHIGRVLRLRKNDEITLFNGDGGEYAATLTAVERQRVYAEIGRFDPRESESPLQLVLAQGISRGERMDYTLQKSVELGVNRIVPLITERCGVKFDQHRAARRAQHWQGVIISACEQCGRNRIPVLLPVTPLVSWLEQVAKSDLNLVLHHRANRSLSRLKRRDGPVTLLIGPEGGLSDGEINAAGRYGFHAVRLGPRILRTETAGVAALATLQSRWGDM